MKFEQAIHFRSEDPAALLDLVYEWDRGQASTDVMGYIGTRLLRVATNPATT